MRLGEFISLTAREVIDDEVTVLAGNVAFRLMFAALPLLVSLIWILRLTGATPLVEGLLDLARLAFPGPAIEPIEEQVRGTTAGDTSGSPPLGVFISVLVSIWATVVAFRATMHALNVVYGVDDGRSQGHRLVISLLISTATIAMFLVALVLIMWGSDIAEGVADRLGLGVSFRVAWAATSWIVVVACVFGAFACTYYFAPDVEQRMRWIGPGSVVGVALWLVYTLLFSLYVNVVSNPEETYGALAGVAVFMLYLYGSTFIVLLGAEMNQVIESCDPKGKDTGEKSPERGKTPEPAAAT